MLKFEVFKYVHVVCLRWRIFTLKKEREKRLHSGMTH
jgi:hypothetical protein